MSALGWPPPQPGYGAAPSASPAPPRATSAVDALKFAFSSPDWGMNLLIGAVFMLIPVVGALALQGWHCEIHQRLVRRHPQPIPRLDFADLGHYLERGVHPFVVNLAVMVPLFMIMYVYMIITAFAAAGISEASGEPAAAVAVVGVLMAFGLAMNLFLTVLLSAAMTRVELTEQIGWSLSPGGIWRYGSRNWGRIFWSSLCFAPLAIGTVIVGMLLFCVGMYPAMVAMQLGSMHLRWQVYEIDLQNGGEVIPLKHPSILPSEARQAAPRYY
jgi:hypothetical protein